MAEGNNLPRRVRGQAPSETFWNDYALRCNLVHFETQFWECYSVWKDLVAFGWSFQYSYLYTVMITIFCLSSGEVVVVIFAFPYVTANNFQMLELASYQTPSKFRLNYLPMVFLGRFHFWSGVILYQRLDDLHAWNCFSKWSEEGSVKGKHFQFYFAHPLADCEEKSSSAMFAVGSLTFIVCVAQLHSEFGAGTVVRRRQRLRKVTLKSEFALLQT